MSAIFSMFKVVPGWCWAILMVVAALLGAELHGRHTIQVKWNAAIAAEKAANDLLVDMRREGNHALAAKQQLDSSNIQRKHDEEVSAARLAAASRKRVRIGTARTRRSRWRRRQRWSRFRRPVGSDGVDRDILALEIRVEEAFAAGRAAQTFIRTNGLAPLP